ncbi:uncharacterized protein LAESUDRAFT_655703 [Laetiporus sulphureus 93-53]|uniref:Uncharacterized protein n=1 Tax=Laetiporus sulphureus 93-53 TaxID=1314785 RepID=A0A165DRW1_9APHY|nr:uncharacterized protein LAESUDRAFT_655703 [Laetiporus sulphureus 93-53]KZT05502.1 hypothetical protein LAESUDRAFT_655703 [Laetiporus sulphureus 93-53]
MSSFMLMGFFAVAGGQRSTSVNAQRGTSTFYNYYFTAIQCSSGDLLLTQLRIYSPRDDIPLSDNTVIFSVAHVHVPANATVLLDTFSVYPFPGDSNDNNYQSPIPDMPYPYAIDLDTVLLKHDILADGKSKAFLVEVHECVHDEQRSSSLQ